MSKPNRTSSNSNRNPYQKLSFWNENRFWNTGLYSQASKDYFNEWLSNWNKSERSLVNRQDNINLKQ